MKKRIVTHKHPHLDEIMCVWMIRRFLRGGEKATMVYVATNAKKRAQQDDAHTMVIGVGRGKFDEHKGNLNDSATTLVYKFILSKKPKLALDEKIALAALVDFVNDDDHGKHISMPFAEFHISACMTYLAKAGKSSSELLNFGATYLDGVFSALTEEALVARDLKKAIRFATPWGPALAVTTTANAKSILRAATAETIFIVVVVGAKTKFRSIRATPECPIDLSDAFEKIHTAEPHAEWYLHHSKKMLICGSDVAENKNLSRASLATLIKLISV